MLTNISPSDLAHGVIVAHIVFSSRDKVEHKWNPMMALCYLAEAIDIPKVRQYRSFLDLSMRFDSVVGTKDGLQDVWQSMCRIDSVDDFSLLVESMGNALLPNSEMDFNGLNGPSLITSESCIGLFLRSLLVQWECLRFDETCQLFGQMKSFLKQPELSSYENPQTDSNALALFDTPYRLFAKDFDGEGAKSGPMEVRTAAISSLQQGDIAETERALHYLFDQNGTDPLRCGLSPSAEGMMPASPEKASEAGIARALVEMLHCDESARTASTKHQHAMLSLAGMWIRAGNCSMALSAIEEALKTAHQRGDHAAVAQSLFLLHSVFQDSNDPTLVASVEDILMRCTKRSAALDLQHLTSQSALLLAQLRSKQSFKESTTVSGDGVRLSASVTSVHQGGINPAEAAVWRVEDIWSQISFSLLGEIALTRQIVTSQGITEDTEFTQAGPSNNMMGPQANNAAKKENLQEVPLSVGPEMVKLSLQASLVASALWARLGMLQMAEFACLRAVRQFSSVAEAEDIAAVYLRWLQVQVQILQLRPVADAPSFESVRLLAKRIRAGLFVPGHVAQQLDSAEVMIAAHSACAKGDFSRALRLAYRLAELRAPATVTVVGLTDAEAEAQVLLAELTARFDPQASQQLLEEIRVSCKKTGSLTLSCWCMFLKGKIVLEQAGGSEVAARDALKEIEHAHVFARRSGLGLVEAHIAKFSSENTISHTTST